ncbi:MAG: thiamine ABC transporter substrate-binding protein [Thermoplasmatota archaeon]
MNRVAVTASAAILLFAIFAGCATPVLPNLANTNGTSSTAASSSLLDLRPFNYSTCTKDATAMNATPALLPSAPFKANATTDLVIAGHDSTAFSSAMLDEFNKTYNARVSILKLGDAGLATTKMILQRNDPPADLFFGVDNTLIVRAHEYGIFQSYKPLAASVIPPCLQFDQSWDVTPLDYGFVNLNYDKAWMQQNNMTPPTTLEQLTQPQWKGKLVVENPATSSPGLAFLLLTIHHFGETGNYTVWDYWKALRANDVAVADSWETAYYQKFTKYGGDRPIVVSYTTSPPAEVYYGTNPNATTSPIGNVPISDGAYLQIEGIGILAHARHVQLAKAFIEFAMSKEFQESFTNLMWVFPVNPQAHPDPTFRFADVPPKPVVLNPTDVAQNQSNWIDLWTNVVTQ